MGFFPLAEAGKVKSVLTYRAPRCGQCQLFKGCQSPKMKVYGAGRRKVLIVGEAPGATEDRVGKPFQGKAGQRLITTAARLGVDLFRDCWVANALRCRPPDNKINDPKKVDFCRPFVIRDIEELKPEVVICLGAMAVRSVIGYLWKEDPGGVKKWMGWQVPSQRWNAWVCATFHPSHLDRMESSNDGQLQLSELYFREHLAAAFAKTSRPWKKVPDYKSKVSMMIDPADAEAGFIAVGKGGMVAFDFETTTLKPDGPDAEIVCCSISDGKVTVAYPWVEPLIGLTRDLISDPGIKKVGYNLKFEDRWCRAKLGCRVRGWAWDGQLAAHALDSRGEGTTKLKFQAFARLGFEDYSETVAPYLKAKGGGNTKNRIREVPLPKLLLYNGLDSLLEYKVAKHQAKEMGAEI